MPLTTDICRCLGRTDFTSDGRICERRTKCLRFTDVPTDCSNTPVAMFLCIEGRDLMIPAGEGSWTSQIQETKPQNCSSEQPLATESQ